MPGLLGSILGSIEGPNIGKGSQTYNQSEQQYGQNNQASQQLLNQGEQAYGQALPYYEGILSGNKADISSALAPEIGNIQSNEKNAIKNTSMFTPQGGGMTSLLSEAPFQESGQITNLISGAQKNAASGLSGLASNLTNQAQGFGSLAEGANQSIINALLGKQGQATSGQLGGAQLGMQAASGGSDIADLLPFLLP